MSEANKALQLLEEDGTAVAVPQVLEQARDDMKKVQGLLFKTEVGPFCQGIEEDIIAALKEIIEVLKKAQQDLQTVAFPALRHRLILNFDGLADGITPEELIETVIEETKPS